jgi:DNA-binding response OmpR family regulator
MGLQALLITRDERIREVVGLGLGAHGFEILHAANGAAAVLLASRSRVGVAIVDLPRNELDAARVLEGIRRVSPDLPAIALAPEDDLRAKVNGLDAGFDDWLARPFAIDELAARVRARLRPRTGDASLPACGDLVLDAARLSATRSGRTVALTAREVSLLAAFMRRPGEVLSRAELLRLVWDIDFDPRSNVVDVGVAALRRKLGRDVIQTVRGVGYRLPAEPRRRA